MFPLVRKNVPPRYIALAFQFAQGCPYALIAVNAGSTTRACLGSLSTGGTTLLNFEAKARTSCSVYICCSVSALSFRILLDSKIAFIISVEEAPFFSNLEGLNEKYVCVSLEFFRVCRCSEAGIRPIVLNLQVLSVFIREAQSVSRPSPWAVLLEKVNSKDGALFCLPTNRNRDPCCRTVANRIWQLNDLDYGEGDFPLMFGSLTRDHIDC